MCRFDIYSPQELTKDKVMFFRVNEKGRSMVEMLGVLGIIGVISAGGLIGYSKAMYYYEFNRTVTTVADAFQDFLAFSKRGVFDYPTDQADMAQNAKASGLMSGCVVTQSVVLGSGYGVCHIPLGEIYPHYAVTDGQYEYQFNVTFIKAKQKACVDFLSKGWKALLPERYWRLGQIKLKSANGDEQTLMGAGVNNMDIQNLSSSCQTMCGDGVQYCSVVFDITGYAR